VRRTIALTGSVVFLDAMLFGAVIPLLPHFADTYGLSKLEAGLLLGAYGAGALLGGIPGVQVREIAEAELCCGSAGTYNLFHPEPARELGARKAAAVRAAARGPSGSRAPPRASEAGGRP